MSQILKILFQTEGINIFVLRGVLFSRYSTKKFLSWRKNIPETHFGKEAVKN